ncbi:threonine ammonia-lyase [Amorphus coralli]|uniref:threonine ammonia-lyase n=1 Tax=Amorphus coralli TaxID=340680 RepID=UPI00035D7FAD|nr:threonine/serine dehydratase [Amorphus coralli]
MAGPVTDIDPETDLPTVDEVRAAAGRIAGHAQRTPLLNAAPLDDRAGGRVLVKAEALQRTGSFKFRGAFNRLSMIPEAERAAGVIACSSGNHAQGVAEAARLLGMPATIVMPADAPAIKRARTIRSGATVVDYDRATENRDAVTRALRDELGATLVHPFDDRGVIAGQGTVGLEIVEDCAAAGIRPDLVLVPTAGGGLAGGIGLAVRDAFPEAELVTVEPVGFDDYARSFAAGERVANERMSGSIADALLAPMPGVRNFALNRARYAYGVAVNDADLLEAVAAAANELKLILEPGGAAALAAVLTKTVDLKGRTAVVVGSGGNIDPAMLARALEAG